MKDAVLYSYWSPKIALILAGVISALYFGITGSVWAVTGEFTRLGGQFLHLFNVDTSGWAYFDLVKLDGTTVNRADGWMVWGMFLGALIMVLLNQSFKLRSPLVKRRWLQALGGGIIAGFGARLAMGCNLAAFFTGVPQFSLHSWLFILTSALGSFLGTHIVKQDWWKGKPKPRRTGLSTVSSHKRILINTSIQPKIAIGLAVIIAMLAIYFAINGQIGLSIALLFGIVFGVLLERGQICFTSALRDLWLFNSTAMFKAIILGMVVSSIITLAFISNGTQPITQITALSTMVGGVLFGLGIVLASACETGMMYRMMEGQLVYLVAFIGNIIGATVLAYGWDHWHIAEILADGGAKINLVNMYQPMLALLFTLLFLLFIYKLVVIKEKFNFLTVIKLHA